MNPTKGALTVFVLNHLDDFIDPLTLKWALGLSLELRIVIGRPQGNIDAIDNGEFMKAWMAGAFVMTFACIVALASSLIISFTWIVNNKNVGLVQALVVTVGIAETGPVLKIREVSAPREGEQLYAAIHDAARIAEPNGASIDDAIKENKHWGGGRSWCNGQDCQRFYIFVASSFVQHVPDMGAYPICQLSAHSGPEVSRRI